MATLCIGTTVTLQHATKGTMANFVLRKPVTVDPRTDKPSRMRRGFYISTQPDGWALTYDYRAATSGKAPAAAPKAQTLGFAELYATLPD